MKNDVHFCPKCGAKLNGQPKFCPKCGYQLTQINESEETPSRRSNPNKKPPKKRRWRVVLVTLIILLLAITIAYFVGRTIKNTQVGSASSSHSATVHHIKEGANSSNDFSDESTSSGDQSDSSSSESGDQLDASTLNATQTAAAITYYADQNGIWPGMVSAGQSGGLTATQTANNINLSNEDSGNDRYDVTTSSSSSDETYSYVVNGSMVYFYVIPSDAATVYTDNSLSPLASVSLSDIVQYANDNSAAQTVEDLASQTTVTGS